MCIRDSNYTVRKKGENQCVGFVASLIDDSYAPGGEKLLEPVAALLGELICDPATERGRFVPSYFCLLYTSRCV